MFVFNWLKRRRQKPAPKTLGGPLPTRRLGDAFRPGLEALDDRLAPSTTSVSAPATTATATHFLVITPEDVTAGTPSPVEVVALTASNMVATGYTGTVLLTNSDTGATEPAAYTFTAADHGIHVFTETPAAVGTDTVTATDTSSSSIIGSASLTVVAAPVATHFAVIAEPAAYAGASVQVAVVALDASNQVVSNYTGTVQLSSTDTGATLPASYTFTSADHGIHVFDVTFATTGSQTVTATDTSSSSITGSASLTVVAAPVATHFAVIAEPAAYAGASVQVAVVALDASNHVVSNYTGTVQLTSSDTAATLPASYTFTSADHGIHVFDVTFATTGSQTVTATSTSSAVTSITGSVSVTVDAAPVATHFAVIAEPAAYAGASTKIVVIALDASNHVVSNYTGTVQLTSSDTGATLPAAYTFTTADHGIHEFNVTFATTGSQTVTATSTSSASKSVSGSVSITVDPAQVATHFAILVKPDAATGSQTQVVVVALDASNHVVTNYTGTVQLTSSDTAATLPAAYTFTAADDGVHVFDVTLATAGTQTITATDTANSTLTATASVTVGSTLTGRGHHAFFV